ncbi:hypothetical protein FRB95_013739 [Tulasnella sp. JGI-2019a]|nr:hypothetical protein FRB95_013739 [Tulasnella sp. JGI-2019a]
MASIVHLAPELISSISRYLSVAETVLFLSCCRYFHSITENRHFWLNHARSMWSHCDIASDLSIAPTLELKRIVARPYRFQRAIIKKNLSRRSPIKLESCTGHLDDACREVILIPGGRWLVALSCRDDWVSPHSLVAYDIRRPAEKNFAVIARLALRPEQGTYPSIAVTSDSAGLGPMIFAQVQHVGPISKSSSGFLSLLTGSDPANRLPIFWTNGHLLAYTYTEGPKQKLLVWDWVNGRYGVYHGDGDSSSPQTVLAAIEEDGALFVNYSDPKKIIKLSWPDSPIEEHLRPTSDPLVVDNPVLSLEEEYLVSDLQDTLPNPHHRHPPIDSKDWSTTSLLISDRSCNRTLLIDIIPKARNFVIQTYPISVLDGDNRPVFHGKTIGEHIVVCDNMGGVTTSPSGGGSTYQIFERDIDRRSTPTQIPFMCPISGTLGIWGGKVRSLSGNVRREMSAGTLSSWDNGDWN